jgi:transcriptional regulator with XRE-family HTH domain
MRKLEPNPPKAGTLGGVIHSMRLAIGITRVVLSRRSGLVPSRITMLEEGLNHPTFATLPALARGLGVKTATLVERIEGEVLRENIVNPHRKPVKMTRKAG